jgi:hypothetical protein
MSDRWNWVIRYVVVLLLAVVLAATLGEMALFKATRFGKSGVNAARLVQFLGYSGALVVFWLLAQRAASLLDARNASWNVLKSILLPLATLVVVACAQAVILLLCGPLMSKAVHQFYNWLAVAAIILSAAWLLAALFTGSSSLTPLFRHAGRRG